MSIRGALRSQSCMPTAFHGAGRRMRRLQTRARSIHSGGDPAAHQLAGWYSILLIETLFWSETNDDLLPIARFILHPFDQPATGVSLAAVGPSARQSKQVKATLIRGRKMESRPAVKQPLKLRRLHIFDFAIIEEVRVGQSDMILVSFC